MNHVIRLRGPWQFEVARHAEGSPPATAKSGKQKLPADWSAAVGDGFRGTVVYRRVFHKPTGLEPGQQVWLAIESVAGSAQVSLNGKPLGTCASERVEFEVTDQLDESNRLQFEVTHDEGDLPGGLTDVVALEIQTVRPRQQD